MKIEKLYTLSQFIDLLFKERKYSLDKIAVIILDYNDFLKQKPTKEMFVNPYEKPNENLYPRSFEGSLKYGADYKQWQEAEKKVIFKGWNINNLSEKEIEITKGNEYFLFYDNTLYDEFDSSYNTLGDLANATNGEIEIKLEL